MLEGFNWLATPHPGMKPYTVLIDETGGFFRAFTSRKVRWFADSLGEIFPNKGRGASFVTSNDEVIMTNCYLQHKSEGSGSLGIPLVSAGSTGRLGFGVKFDGTYIYHFDNILRRSVVDLVAFKGLVDQPVMERIGKKMFDRLRNGQVYAVTEIVMSKKFSIMKANGAELGLGVAALPMSLFEGRINLLKQATSVFTYDEVSPTTIAFRVARLEYDSDDHVVRFGEHVAVTYRGGAGNVSDEDTDFRSMFVEIDE
jgi:hypothetical protein